MPKPTHPPPPRRSSSKRPPPKPVKQASTGPMKFGLGRQGIFITGEDARKILSHLREIKVDDEHVLGDLAKVFQWGDESPSELLEVQFMKPYWECTKD